MDRTIATALGLGDCHPKEVATHGAVSGKIDGHPRIITLPSYDLNRAILKTGLRGCYRQCSCEKVSPLLDKRELPRQKGSYLLAEF
jgi:hypothetical protein